MRNPIFDFFGGRKNFNLYFGVVLVVVWQLLEWPKESLWVVLGLLGLTNGALAVSDLGNKTKTVFVPDDQEVVGE